MAPIIEIKNLVKRYGKLTAVNDMSLQVEAGAIFGFVGPNGAGKTTTMRILTTLMAPTSGEAHVAGHSVIKDPRSVRKAIGYMPDFFGVYDDMTVWEYLDFFGACYEIPEAQRQPINRDLLELVDLSHRKDDRVEGLSRGMKQRLALARTLAHDPQVLILDEPASGLDPRARIEIRELLVELARMGKTIFFSTHILADVAEICTHVGIVEAGRLVAMGKLEEMQRMLMPHRRIHVNLLGKGEEATAALMAIEGVTNVQNEGPEEEAAATGHHRLVVEYNGSDTEVSAILAKLISLGIPVFHFSEDVRDMEEVFMRATQGIVS